MVSYLADPKTARRRVSISKRNFTAVEFSLALIVMMMAWAPQSPKEDASRFCSAVTILTRSSTPPNAGRKSTSYLGETISRKRIRRPFSAPTLCGFISPDYESGAMCDENDCCEISRGKSSSGSFDEGFFPGFTKRRNEYAAQRQHRDHQQRGTDWTLQKYPRIAAREEHRPAQVFFHQWTED